MPNLIPHVKMAKPKKMFITGRGGDQNVITILFVREYVNNFGWPLTESIKIIELSFFILLLQTLATLVGQIYLSRAQLELVQRCFHHRLAPAGQLAAANRATPLAEHHFQHHSENSQKKVLKIKCVHTYK